jgi:hypothetical protein
MDAVGSNKYVPSGPVTVDPTRVDVPQRYAFTVTPARPTSLVSRIPLQLASQKMVPPRFAQAVAEAIISERVNSDFRMRISFLWFGGSRHGVQPNIPRAQALCEQI